MQTIHLIENFTYIDPSNPNIQIVSDLAIYQGKTFDCLTFSVEGDQTSNGLTAKGQVRNTYLKNPDIESILYGDFTFPAFTYDSNTNTTVIKPILEASVTFDIPYTQFQGNGTPSNKVCWVYDICTQLGTKITPILKGFVQVIPTATTLN
jgi:hypothetical protein